MPLSRDELAEMKQRADELVKTAETAVRDYPPPDPDPPMDALLKLLARLKNDNHRLVEEVERLWREQPPD